MANGPLKGTDGADDPDDALFAGTCCGLVCYERDAGRNCLKLWRGNPSRRNPLFWGPDRQGKPDRQSLSLANVSQGFMAELLEVLWTSGFVNKTSTPMPEFILEQKGHSGEWCGAGGNETRVWYPDVSTWRGKPR